MMPAHVPDWSGYSGPLRATLDEYSRAIKELEKIFIALPQETYESKTQLSDKTFADLRDIMAHVIGAAHVYVDYLNDAIDKTDRGPQTHDYSYDTPTAAMQSVWEAFSRMVVMLGRIKDYSEGQQARHKVTTRWGTEYDIEQMLEHAIVHILRHRRQVERWLASS